MRGINWFGRHPKPSAQLQATKELLLNGHDYDLDNGLIDEDLLVVQRELRQMGYRQTACAECGSVAFAEMPCDCGCGSEDYEGDL